MSILFAILLVSPSLGSPGGVSAAYQTAKTKCQVMEDPGNISLSDYNVTLNGKSVDSVNCNKLDAYTYPKTEYTSFRSTPSPLHFILTILAPSAILLISGTLIARYFSVSIREAAFIFLVSFVAFIASLLMFGTIDNYLRNYNEMIHLIPLLVGILSPAAYIAYRKQGQETGSKAESVIAFIFSFMLYWLVIGTIFVVQTPL